VLTINVGKGSTMTQCNITIIHLRSFKGRPST